MTYALPFKPGQRLIELGGGANPRIRPNADVRPGPTVDVVCDFEQPLPLAPNSFDGVLAVYVAEHLNWRATRQFFSEVHRILAPGGVAVFFLPNTEEQLRNALTRPSWDDTVSSMLFGDGDYEHNWHKAAFSPAYTARLMQEAGFFAVEVQEHPQTKSDMIIHARKSAADVRYTL